MRQVDLRQCAGQFVPFFLGHPLKRSLVDHESIVRVAPGFRRLGAASSAVLGRPRPYEALGRGAKVIIVPTVAICGHLWPFVANTMED
jgi:hypothetical protein